MTGTELVEIMNGQALTTSLKVAAHFKKRHDHVVRDIKSLIKDLEGVPKNGETPLFTESTYVHEQNSETYPMYYMNRDGYTLLAMGFNGKKALQFKLDYINAFNSMETKLKEIELEHQRWAAVRDSTKKTFRKLTDAIQMYIIPLARKQGSTTADDVFYMTYAKMLNQIIGCKPAMRDDLTVTQLHLLDQIQDIACMTIHCFAITDTPYKQIYQHVKYSLESFAKIALVPERFRPQAMLS